MSYDRYTVKAVLVILLIIIIGAAVITWLVMDRKKEDTSDEDHIPEVSEEFGAHQEQEESGVMGEAAAKFARMEGYGKDMSWNDTISATELDPSTFVNHQDFVKDVRRFSSGANFTSVTDDNTNAAFTNFVGLRRPEHVPIGASAREQPDIDQSVLKRNGGLRWGYSAKDSTYLTAEQNNVPAGQYQFTPEDNVNYEM